MEYQRQLKYDSTGNLGPMYETLTSKTTVQYSQLGKKDSPGSSPASTPPPQPPSAQQPTKSTLLQELLECPICMNLYDNPHVLPCQHTFCKKCIVSLHNTSSAGGGALTIDCPICREKHTLANGVNSLAANYTMKRLIELDAIQMTSEKEKQQQLVKERPREVVRPIKAKCFSCQKFAYLKVCSHCSYTLCHECTLNPDHDIIIGILICPRDPV